VRKSIKNLPYLKSASYLQLE